MKIGKKDKRGREEAGVIIGRTAEDITEIGKNQEGAEQIEGSKRILEGGDGATERV